MQRPLRCASRGARLDKNTPANAVMRRARVHLGSEIARLVDIGDEPGLFRLPGQQRPRTLA
jgi:hypothetical protein